MKLSNSYFFTKKEDAIKLVEEINNKVLDKLK